MASAARRRRRASARPRGARASATATSTPRASTATRRTSGAAIRASGVARAPTCSSRPSSGTTTRATTARCAPSTRASERLGLEYVDLYLIHWPVAGKRLESWRALERIVDGKARAVNRRQQLPRAAPRGAPRHGEGACRRSNQIELTPFLQQRETRAFCAKHGIVVEAYSPLTRGQRLDHPVVARRSRSA